MMGKLEPESKPYISDGLMVKTHGFPVIFPTKPIQ
jgi:hypothetical protein